MPRRGDKKGKKGGGKKKKGGGIRRLADISAHVSLAKDLIRRDDLVGMKKARSGSHTPKSRTPSGRHKGKTFFGLSHAEAGGMRSALAKLTLDPKLEMVLQDLVLMDYFGNFLEQRVIYDDLPDLTPDQLAGLIPDPIPRRRLLKYLSRKYSSATLASSSKYYVPGTSPFDPSPPSGHSPHPVSAPVFPGSPVAGPGSFRGPDGAPGQDSADLRGRQLREPWWIDPRDVMFDYKGPRYAPGRSGTAARGAFGLIKTGMLRVGLAEIPIAVKEIHIDGYSTKKSSVVAEVLAMHLLKHPNVVKTFGCWFSDDELVANICLEFCRKGDLENWRRSATEEISPVRKVEILHQISNGMAYIHERNFVHRDLKLANVLISDDEGTVKICDFGASKNIAQVHGTMCGTPTYIAPEVFFALKNSDPKLVDIYSFGILMWSFWTGLLPYADLQKKHSSNALTFLMAVHGHRSDKKFDQKRPGMDAAGLEDCPPRILELIPECWDAEPKNRPRGFAQIQQNLFEILRDLKGLPVAAAPIRTSRPGASRQPRKVRIDDTGVGSVRPTQSGGIQLGLPPAAKSQPAVKARPAVKLGTVPGRGGKRVMKLGAVPAGRQGKFFQAVSKGSGGDVQSDSDPDVEEEEEEGEGSGEEEEEEEGGEEAEEEEGEEGEGDSSEGEGEEASGEGESSGEGEEASEEESSEGESDGSGEPDAAPDVDSSGDAEEGEEEIEEGEEAEG